MVGKSVEPVEAVEIEEILEDMRNRLISESRREPEAERRGYINGVLDMYNEAKKLEEKKEKLNERHRAVE